MGDTIPKTSRRSAFRKALGYSAAIAGLAAGKWNKGAGFSLIPFAQAQSHAGVRGNNGDILAVKGRDAITSQMAEWVNVNSRPGRNRIVMSEEARGRAPDDASHYEAKFYNFPCGNLRTLTFKKGTPVFHQITFEAHIYVLQGSATLRPLAGLSGERVTVKEGDALFLPSGVLESENADEDFIILQHFVAYTSENPRSTIVTADEALSYQTAQWQGGDEQFTLRTPNDDVSKAPANATRWSSNRYNFDGNSIRVATFKKGGRSNLGTTQRRDVLIYISKGHFRRHEGDDVFDLRAGDVLREKMGNPGYWEPLEDSQFIATDAPITATDPVAGWTQAVNEAASEGTTLFEMGIDHNNRSAVGVLNIPMQKLGEYESISTKQDATYFRIGFRPWRPKTRTAADYASAAGPFEMHAGGAPHFVARMVGATENTMQDGAVFRQTAGDFVYVRPGSLHHSNQVGYTPGVVMNLFMPGTDLDTQPLVIK